MNHISDMSDIITYDQFLKTKDAYEELVACMMIHGNIQSNILNYLEACLLSFEDVGDYVFCIESFRVNLLMRNLRNMQVI